MFLHGMAGEQKREEVEEDEEELQQYTPHIPGTVLYLHRCHSLRTQHLAKLLFTVSEQFLPFPQQ